MKSTVLLFAFACFAAGLTSCATTKPSAAQKAAIPWTRAIVVAFDLELDDPIEIYLLMFSRNGSVGVDAGQKHGLITAPLYEWKIVDGRLRIVDYDGSIIDELTLLSREPAKIIVRRRNGKVVTFKLRPSPVA